MTMTSVRKLANPDLKDFCHLLTTESEETKVTSTWGAIAHRTFHETYIWRTSHFGGDENQEFVLHLS